MDPAQEARAQEIRTALLKTGAETIRGEHRTALVEELTGLLTTAPTPAGADPAAAQAAIARAERIGHALFSHRWDGHDRKLLSAEYGDALAAIPNGSSTPRAMTPPADPSSLPFALLPASLHQRLRYGETQAEIRADLDAALAGLPGAADGAGA